MNKKQYFRLTLVLVIPLAIFSWWLSHQEFIVKQGRVSDCSWNKNSCYMTPTPLAVISSIADYPALKYEGYDKKTALFFLNFDAPIQAGYYGEQGKLIPYPWITAKTLDSYGCFISGFSNSYKYTYNYRCTSKTAIATLPQESSFGKFSFANKEDAEKFIRLVSLSKKQVNDYNNIYIWTALMLFIGMFGFYFMLSYSIKFIIYGFKKQSTYEG